VISKPILSLKETAVLANILMHSTSCYCLNSLNLHRCVKWIIRQTTKTTSDCNNYQNKVY